MSAGDEGKIPVIDVIAEGVKDMLPQDVIETCAVTLKLAQAGALRESHLLVLCHTAFMAGAQSAYADVVKKSSKGDA